MDENRSRTKTSGAGERVLFSERIQHVEDIADASEGRDRYVATESCAAGGVEGALPAFEELVSARHRSIDDGLPIGEILACSRIDQVDMDIPAEFMEIDVGCGRRDRSQTPQGEQ